MAQSVPNKGKLRLATIPRGEMPWKAGQAGERREPRSVTEQRLHCCRHDAMVGDGFPSPESQV
jgi:hypothetical protein